MSRVRNGNFGGVGVEVRRGVSACACFCALVNLVVLGWESRKEVAYHVMNADQWFVQCRGKCLCCTGTNTKTAGHTWAITWLARHDLMTTDIANLVPG
jgi:hypothetical protein